MCTTSISDISTTSTSTSTTGTGTSSTATTNGATNRVIHYRELSTSLLTQAWPMSPDHREGLHIRCFKHLEAPERARWGCQESSMATTSFCCGLLPQWGSPRSNLHSQIGRRTADPWASKSTECVWSRLCGINSCESWWWRLYVQLHHDDATERGPGTHCHQRQFLAVFFQQRDAPRQDYNEICYSCWNLRSARSLEIRLKARCILSWLDDAALSQKFDGWGRYN